MSGERREFDKEFKLMSVELSGPPRGNSRTDLGAFAKELDIPPAMLYRWRRAFSAKQNGSFPGNGKVILSETEQELARLRKELRDTQLERDILKKAVSMRCPAFPPGAMADIRVHKGSPENISH
jgi:transposase